MTISSEPILEHPVLVVGVPVFNEVRFLQETLTSLASQEWTDFAVLIADNASDDGSDAIARSFCEADPRFRLHRQSSNVGGLGNFRFLHEATRSPLFMWLGAHDVLAPDFLSETVLAHHRDPAITLAYTFMHMVDPNGNLEYLLENERLARMPIGRMTRYLHAYRHVQGYEINHVLRRSALDDYAFRMSYAWDLIFLSHLAFHGPFACIPKHLYFVRNVHPRDHETAEETMERLTAEKGRSHDVDDSIDHLVSDFTQLARGRFGWKLHRSLIRAVALHRWRRGLGVLSTALSATARIRTRGWQPIRKRVSDQRELSR